MIPKIVHTIWLGGPMPDMAKGHWQTFVDQNPAYCFMHWNESGVKSLGLDAGRLKEQLGTWASVSNLIRLLAVEKYGGTYADCDVECLKPIDPLLVHPAFAATQDDQKAGENDGRICNAVFGAEAHHPWLKWQIDNAPRFQNGDAAWGVYLMSEAPREGLTLVPRHLVYPWTYETPAELRKPHPESILSHEWEGSWLQK